MKIVCDSCSAKYSIADEKVAGRVFKIRCKKCGSAIVVRGDQVDNAAEGEAANQAVDYGGDAVWHVVIDGDQQGPYAPAQIGEMLSVGTIGWDAYVWKEGFDDWKPAQDIEELVSAVMGGSEDGGGEASESEAPPAAAAAADPFAATAASDSLFGGDDAAVGGRDAGADLFAQSDAASPFGGGAEEEDDLVASANPRVSADQALTGARNENSVLFSLSNLQALATGGSEGASASSSAPSPSPSAQPRAGMAAGEGSGLIDIRALASATGMMGGGGASGPVTSASADNKVDDLLSIGGAGAAGLGSSLGAPVLVPEAPEESSNKGIIIGGAIAVIGLLAAAVVVLAFVLMSDDDPPAQLAASGAVPPGQVVAATGTETGAAGAATPATPATPEPAAAGGTEAAEADEPAGETDEPSEDDEGSDSAAPSSSGSRSGSRRGSRGSRSAAAAAASPASPATPAAASSGSRSGGRRSGGSNDIDDLLNGALGGGSAPARAERPAPAASGPSTPSRGNIVSAMNSVAGPVRACANGTHGVATVRVVFGGSNGRVTGATVNAASLPGPVRSCIARAVRGASVPPFRQSSFSVNYPFRL